ncbi:unnamed protein product, partial [Rotaria sordida]
MSYGVEDDSDLELVNPDVKTRSMVNLGMRFADVYDTKGLKRTERSRIAPRWQQVRPGLCLE